MAAPLPLWDSAALSNQILPPRLPTRPMDMDLKDFMEFVQTTARSVGAEISSPWFYLQFGLMLAAAGIAYAAEATIRSRVDMTSLAMRLPLPLRHFARVMVASASTAVFTMLVIVS